MIKIKIMKIKTIKLRAVLRGCSVAGLALAGASQAEVKPSALFSDHMVLQRGMDVPVWGDADPGERIEVAFSGQNHTTVADEDGKWMVELSPLKASSEGREITIEGSNKLVFSDVLVGEVWICSGQSNMQIVANAVPEIKVKVPKAGDVRSFTVPCTVAFDEQDSLVGQWDLRVANSAVAAGFSMFLEEAIDVPVGIILSAWGSSSLEAWMPRDMAADLPLFAEQLQALDSDQETRGRIEKALAAPERLKPDDVFMRRQSNILYNAMMKPLVPYACRGLVWYQGERNAFNFHDLPEEPWYRRNIPITGYENALKLWVKRYRKEWQKEDMHFMVVMLPGYAGHKLKTKAERPDVESWAWMREAQLGVLELPHTSVVNTIDLGDVTNIHPKDKAPIGERLALLAQRDVLQRDVVAEGPVMKNVVLAGDHLKVSFSNGEGLSIEGGAAPEGFWITDDTQVWHPAVAAVKGETVILSSPDIEEPLYIRYAFAAMPKTNLVNGAGLPARPFRTDHFTK